MTRSDVQELNRPAGIIADRYKTWDTLNMNLVLKEIDKNTKLIGQVLDSIEDWSLGHIWTMPEIGCITWLMYMETGINWRWLLEMSQKACQDVIDNSWDYWDSEVYKCARMLELLKK